MNAQLMPKLVGIGAAVVLVVAVVLVILGCGRGGIPVSMKDNLHLDPIRMEGTLPVAMQGPISIAPIGPISIQLQGPSAEYEGTYVSEALMDHIQLGTTTAEWVTAVVGKPDSQSTLSDGSEIWKWVYRPAGSASLVSLLGQQDKERPTPQPITAYVRIKDGVVVDKWRG